MGRYFYIAEFIWPVGWTQWFGWQGQQHLRCLQAISPLQYSTKTSLFACFSYTTQPYFEVWSISWCMQVMGLLRRWVQGEAPAVSQLPLQPCRCNVLGSTQRPWEHKHHVFLFGSSENYLLLLWFCLLKVFTVQHESTVRCRLLIILTAHAYFWVPVSQWDGQHCTTSTSLGHTLCSKSYTPSHIRRAWERGVDAGSWMSAFGGP